MTDRIELFYRVDTPTLERHDPYGRASDEEPPEGEYQHGTYKKEEASFHLFIHFVIHCLFDARMFDTL